MNKKLILPIWLGVGEDDGKKFSPILAGRLAAEGDKGVEHVVDRLRWAINASLRTHEVETQSTSEIALRGLTDRLDAEEAQSGVRPLEVKSHPPSAPANPVGKLLAGPAIGVVAARPEQTKSP